MSVKWDQRFLELARHLSGWSKDPSTQVGCVVVGPDREVRSTGFNGFPRGIADSDDRLTDREQKYPLICHAEENAIMHAARIGVALKGCVAYVTWPPCTRCARSLVQAPLPQCQPGLLGSPHEGHGGRRGVASSPSRAGTWIRAGGSLAVSGARLGRNGGQLPF